MGARDACPDEAARCGRGSVVALDLASATVDVLVRHDGQVTSRWSDVRRIGGLYDLGDGELLMTTKGTLRVLTGIGAAGRTARS